MSEEVNSLRTKLLGEWLCLGVCIRVTQTFHLFSIFKTKALQTGKEVCLEWKLIGILNQEIITSFCCLVAA